MYDVENIDIWTFDTEQGLWQTPVKIAEWWGDAGYSIDVQAWIEDLNKDGLFDIVRRTLETDTDLEDPKFATSTKRTDTVFLWEKDHFKDVTERDLPKIKLKKYTFNEEGKK